MDEVRVDQGKKSSAKSSTLKNLLKASIFTHGCFYRDQGVKYMSMYGSVTDVQVFSRELTDLEMEEMTGCRWALDFDWNN